MSTVPKHDFLPEAPDPPFKIVLLRELKSALLAKKLGRVLRDPPKRKVKSWWSKRYEWMRPRHHPTIIRSERWCDSEILSDLQTGSLIAFTRSGGMLNSIPSAYWKDKYVGLSLGGILFDIVENKTFPREFSGNSIFILDECARPWLSRREIDENNPAFPDRLRTRPPTRPTPMPPDKEILAQLIRLAADYGRDRAAIKIRSVRGFENVGNAYARGLMANNLRRGRPRKNK